MKAGEEQSVWQGEGCGVPRGSQALVHLGWAGLGWAGESISSPTLATVQERDVSVLGDALPCCTHRNNVSLGSAGVGHGPGRCPLLRAAPSEPTSIPEGKS